MGEANYQENVKKNYQLQKIAYILTLATSIGLAVCAGAICVLLRPVLGEGYFKGLATAFVLTMLIVFFCFLCVDIILGTIAFFLCKKSTKKYMEDSQEIRQYKVCMGVSYGILTFKILYLFIFASESDVIPVFVMILFYVIVVVKGIISTYFTQ